jgi:hypothetical protein
MAGKTMPVGGGLINCQATFGECDFLIVAEAPGEQGLFAD